MPRQNQARKALRLRMTKADVKVKDLARDLGHDSAVISKAINHGRYPRVLAKIKEALGHA